MEPTPSRLVITGDYDLLLLDSQRQGLEGWVLMFKDTGVEAVIVKVQDDGVELTAGLAWTAHTVHTGTVYCVLCTEGQAPGEDD